MKDKLLQIRVDSDFLAKLEHLRNINGFKTVAETVRKIVEKEFRKEKIEPTIEPNQKTGTWILDNSRLRGNRYICDQCEYETDTGWNPPGNYCPNCGAKMKHS